MPYFSNTYLKDLSPGFVFTTPDNKITNWADIFDESNVDNFDNSFCEVFLPENGDDYELRYIGNGKYHANKVIIGEFLYLINVKSLVYLQSKGVDVFSEVIIKLIIWNEYASNEVIEFIMGNIDDWSILFEDVIFIRNCLTPKKLPILNYLIENGFDVAAFDSKRPGIYFAGKVLIGIETLRVLVDHTIIPPRSFFRTALKKNKLSIVKYHISKGENIHAPLPNPKVPILYNDLTPLELACVYSNFDVIKELVDAGASPCGVGNRSSMFAVKRGSMKILELIMQHGGDIDTIRHGSSYEWFDPVEAAVGQGSLTFVKYLRKLGVNFYGRFSTSKLVNMVHLNRGQMPEIIEYLLEEGLEVEDEFIMNIIKDDRLVVVRILDKHYDLSSHVELVEDCGSKEMMEFFREKGLIEGTAIMRFQEKN